MAGRRRPPQAAHGFILSSASGALPDNSHRAGYGSLPGHKSQALWLRREPEIDKLNIRLCARRTSDVRIGIFSTKHSGYEP